MYDGEKYFDLPASGAFHEDGYVVQGGPGRAVFDAATKQFLRMEPLGGVQPTVEEKQVDFAGNPIAGVGADLREG